MLQLSVLACNMIEAGPRTFIVKVLSERHITCLQRRDAHLRETLQL